MTFQQIVGAGVMLLFLADIFLTVLYARAGTGLLAPRWNRLVWTGLIRRVAPVLDYRPSEIEPRRAER